MQHKASVALEVSVGQDGIILDVSKPDVTVSVNAGGLDANVEGYGHRAKTKVGRAFVTERDDRVAEFKAFVFCFHDALLRAKTECRFC
jgi:hypothetical protein